MTREPAGPLPSPWTLAGFALWGVLFIVWQPFAWWRAAAGVVFLAGSAWAAAARRRRTRSQH